MHQMRISTNEVSSMVLEPKMLEIGKEKLWKVYRAEKIILCHEIEPNPSKERAMHEGDIYFLLDSFIHIRIYKQISKYIATGL